MPVRYALDEELDLVYLGSQRVVTTRQYLDCIETYARHPGFHPKMDVLLDFRGMSAYELGEDEDVERMGRVIQRTRSGKTDYRVACIVRTEEEETLVAMGKDVLYRAAVAKSFYDLSEAFRWLGHTEGEEHVQRLKGEAVSPKGGPVK